MTAARDDLDGGTGDRADRAAAAAPPPDGRPRAATAPGQALPQPGGRAAAAASLAVDRSYSGMRVAAV